MTLRIPAKVLIHVWSYDFYDMTLSTGKQRRHMINRYIHFNPNLTMYHELVESTFVLRGVRSDFNFYLIFDEISPCKRNAPGGTPRPRSATSHLGLYCLPMSHRKVMMYLNWCSPTVLYLCPEVPARQQFRDRLIVDADVIYTVDLAPNATERFGTVLGVHHKVVKD